MQPSLDALRSLVETDLVDEKINLYPIYKYAPADDITLTQAYLKLARLNSKNRTESFFFDSAVKGDSVDRYSFIGIRPKKVIRTGDNDSFLKEYRDVDPISILEEELDKYHQVQFPGLPNFKGGAVGYISYDCIKYFEPTTKVSLKDPLRLPEAVFMVCDIIVVFDSVYRRMQIIRNVELPKGKDVTPYYESAVKEIEEIEQILSVTSDELVDPYQPPIKEDQQFTSNLGQAGYEKCVNTLKDHIVKGDIIQAVPSQRVSRPTTLHPFNLYRHLRTVNPSPYLFYIDLLDFQIIGASPELLVKSDVNNKIVTHPIAGTIKRGQNAEEEEHNAYALRNSLKDKAEHIMLVDLARNDVNRICTPESNSVDRLLTIQRLSHVMHLVSEVSGTLRDGLSRYDAFRSIFPAGTVSGAPKVKAMTLISELEGEKRGVYAGAVGHWGYDGKSMDTCIALRTMVFKEGTAYLQAGGGIVFDSDSYEEYLETMNKMKANNNTIVEAEKIWLQRVGTEP